MDLEDLLSPYGGYKPSVEELVRCTARRRARRGERSEADPVRGAEELDDWGRRRSA